MDSSPDNTNTNCLNEKLQNIFNDLEQIVSYSDQNCLTDSRIHSNGFILNRRFNVKCFDLNTRKKREHDRKRQNHFLECEHIRRHSVPRP